MKVTLSSVMVDDQDRAERFYTDVLGFVKRQDIPMGQFRWLTVASPEGPQGVELALEPNNHPAAKVFQKALFDDGIPATAFESVDLRGEHARLSALGVAFRGAPAQQGPVMTAMFDDTCGNLIQLYQVIVD
jgi:catechol 2,3-dioxygenase-like lactoylglutathione lyase family enzyme